MGLVTEGVLPLLSLSGLYKNKRKKMDRTDLAQSEPLQNTDKHKVQEV